MLENIDEQRPYVPPVLRRLELDDLAEQIAVENAGLICKEAEHEPHHEHGQRVTGIPVCEQGFVQLRHDLGGLDVDIGGFVIMRRGMAREYIEGGDVLSQFGQRELDRLAAVREVHAESSKVRDDNQLGQILFSDAVEVVSSLLKRGRQVVAC